MVPTHFNVFTVDFVVVIIILVSPHDATAQHKDTLQPFLSPLTYFGVMYATHSITKYYAASNTLVAITNLQYTACTDFCNTPGYTLFTGKSINTLCELGITSSHVHILCQVIAVYANNIFPHLAS